MLSSQDVIASCTVICCMSISAKLSICTVVGLNGTPAKTHIQMSQVRVFSFNKCPI